MTWILTSQCPEKIWQVQNRPHVPGNCHLVKYCLILHLGAQSMESNHGANNKDHVLPGLQYYTCYTATQHLVLRDHVKQQL